MSASSRSRRRGRGKQARVHRSDRRLAVAVALVTVGLLAPASRYLDPIGPTSWGWQLLMLCVVVGAVAGRALLGPSSGATGGEQGPREQSGDRPLLRPGLLVWMLLVAAAVLPNLQGLWVGFLADDYLVVGSARSGGGPLGAMRLVPLQVFYRPVSALVWWIIGHSWGWSALGFHVLSLLLHTANTALLYLLARRYIGSVYGATMAALLFAVHPLHVEPTTWIAAQPDLLCLLFCLVSLWGVEGYLLASRLAPRALALAGALVAYCLALYSKEIAMAFPGVVFLRLALRADQQWRRTVTVTAAFGLVLGSYLVVRRAVLGDNWLASYRPGLDFWNTVFPSMPLRMMLVFFFPVHQGLFASIHSPAVDAVALAVLAVGLLWWIRGLEFVPWRRMAFCAGWLLVVSVPAWTLSYSVGGLMGNSRFAYLPTIGLALLFGEIHAHRPSPGRRCRWVGAAVLLAATVLSVWYAANWRRAARLRDDMLAAGVRVVEGLPESPPATAVLVKDLPEHYHGAPVCANAYGIALSPLLKRPIAIQELPPLPGKLEMLSASDLRPGEYLVSWQADRRSMVIERAGCYGRGTVPREASP